MYTTDANGPRPEKKDQLSVKNLCMYVCIPSTQLLYYVTIP